MSRFLSNVVIGRIPSPNTDFVFDDGFIYYEGQQLDVTFISGGLVYLVLFYLYESDTHKYFCETFKIKPFSYLVPESLYSNRERKTGIINFFCLAREIPDSFNAKHKNCSRYLLVMNRSLMINSKFKIMEYRGLYDPRRYHYCLLFADYYSRSGRNYMEMCYTSNMQSEIIALNVHGFEDMRSIDSELLKKLIIKLKAKLVVFCMDNAYCVFDCKSRKFTDYHSHVNNHLHVNANDVYWLSYIKNYYYSNKFSHTKSARF